MFCLFSVGSAAGRRPSYVASVWLLYPSICLGVPALLLERFADVVVSLGGVRVKDAKHSLSDCQGLPELDQRALVISLFVQQ